MTTITASEAQAGLYRLIDQAAESHKPVVISGKRANAVLVSEEDWSAIQETLYLLAIDGLAGAHIQKCLKRNNENDLEWFILIEAINLKMKKCPI